MSRLPSRLVATSDLQRQVVIRLVVGGLIVFGLVIAAAFFVAVPRGPMSVGAAARPVDQFMEAGARNDLVAASAQFSSPAVVAGARQHVADLLANRYLFQTYEGLQVTRFEVREEAEPMPVAILEGLTTYGDGPTGSVAARLVLERNRWRIETLRLNRRPDTLP